MPQWLPAALWPTPQPAPTDMPAAIRAALPAALEMVASSEAMRSSEQSMRALSQHQRPRDVLQCQHEAAMAACCCRRVPCAGMLSQTCATDGKKCKPAPRAVACGSPLATRATAPGFVFAFLACTQPRALCTQYTQATRARLVTTTTHARHRNLMHPHCTPPPALPQTHRPLLAVVAGAQTYGRHCVFFV